MSDLKSRRCTPCEGGVPAIGADDARRLLEQIAGWALDESADALHRAFEFPNFHQTMAFVNAVAWIAHVEDHHPDLEVSYRRCLVRYRTHAIDGLSDNDFICAAKVNALLD